MPHQPTSVDIAIIGAGPAGAHLARRLARAGFDVALFDHQAPWEKPCGGGITHKAWSQFPILRDAALPRNDVYNSLQISPGGRFFVINEGHALVVTSREALGRLMLDAALDAGAVHVPQRVDEVTLDGDLVRLVTVQGVWRARFVVGADGVRSVVRRAFLGPLPKDRTLGAVCQYFEGGPADATLIRVSPVPGYAWAFARHDCLAVGAGALRADYDLRGELARFMADFYPDRRPLGPLRGALLPYIRDVRAYREPRVGDRWALIGDAAGFVDTLTGEGIGYAVWSADLLADALLAGHARQYERAWRRAFGPHLLTGAYVARYLFTPAFLDRFFTAITISPALRGVFMDFIWNLPPYPRLLAKAGLALPRILAQWRGFMRRGGVVPIERLAPFASLADHVNRDLRRP